MKTIYFYVLIIFSMVLTACSSEHHGVVAIDAQIKASLQGVSGLQSRGDHSARITEQGIQVLAGSKTVMVNGDFEVLNMIHHQDEAWYFTIEKSRELVVMNQQGDTFKQTLPAPIEGMCSDFKEEDGVLFVLMDNGEGIQFHLGFDQSKKTNKSISPLQITKLRTISLPPLSEYCVIDSRFDRVLLSEHGVGVWAIPLDLEQEMQRTLVDTVAQGQLGNTPTAMTILHDRLWITDGNALNQYQLGLNSFTFEQRYQFADEYEADQLLLSNVGAELIFLLLDDNEKRWLTFTLDKPDFNEQGMPSIARVKPSVETQPVPLQGDVADDPAIWVHPQDGQKSLVLGTNKKAGLHVYDLAGSEVQVIENGRLNNVDLIQGFTLKGLTMDIAAASHRDHSSIVLFSMDAKTGLVTVQNELQTGLTDVYGFCMGRDPEGNPLALINTKDGRYEVYAITDSPQGWQGERVREFSLPSQPEGCVYDRQQHLIFMGEEDAGIWTLDYRNPNAQPKKVVSVNGDWLVDDVEGLDIYYTQEKSMLVVSSQGNDSYVLLDTKAPHGFIHRFKIGLNLSAGIDGASETDGLAVTSANLGEGFEAGMLVVQDGRNYLPSDLQNFKYVAWQDILDSMIQQ